MFAIILLLSFSSFAPLCCSLSRENVSIVCNGCLSHQHQVSCSLLLLRVQQQQGQPTGAVHGRTTRKLVCANGQPAAQDADTRTFPVHRDAEKLSVPAPV